MSRVGFERLANLVAVHACHADIDNGDIGFEGFCSVDRFLAAGDSVDLKVFRSKVICTARCMVALSSASSRLVWHEPWSSIVKSTRCRVVMLHRDVLFLSALIGMAHTR